jgi:hypothetical protein
MSHPNHGMVPTVCAGERARRPGGGRGTMEAVIIFPLEDRIADGRRVAVGEPTSIIILPMVRIERQVDEPTGAPGTGNSPGRRRRTNQS